MSFTKKEIRDDVKTLLAAYTEELNTHQSTIDIQCDRATMDVFRRIYKNQPEKFSKSNTFSDGDLLPADWVEPLNAGLSQNGKPMTSLDPVALGGAQKNPTRLASVDVPMWYLADQKIYFEPSASLATIAPATIYYIRRPKDLSPTSVPDNTPSEMPDNTRYMIAAIAAQHTLQTLDNPGRRIESFKSTVQSLTSMMNDLQVFETGVMRERSKEARD
jgi:hypothetical protein